MSGGEAKMVARKSMGRQKIEMVKMKHDGNLQVTFSKRRSGLFKKASELCTLCGAEVSIIVFSPGGKVFSFGHPSVDAVVERFVTRDPPPTSGTMQLIEAHRNATVRELNLQLTQVLSQLEGERKRGEELNKMRKASQRECWWEGPVEQLSKPQLEQLKAALEELKKTVGREADKVLMMQSTSSSQSQPLLIIPAGSTSEAPQAQAQAQLLLEYQTNMLPPPPTAPPAFPPVPFF